MYDRSACMQTDADAQWACCMLFKGATCQVPDDWKVEHKRLQQELKAKNQKEVLQKQLQVLSTACKQMHGVSTASLPVTCSRLALALL